MEIINYGPEISILVVDDDQIYLSILSTILRKLNHHVVAMKNPVDALDALRRKEKSFDLIITDVHMPEMSGLELLKHVGEEFKLPVVLMSADTDKDIMLKGLNDGAMFYLTKPISSQKLTRIWQFVNPPIDESPTSNPLPSIQTTSLIPSATNFMRIQDQPEKMDVNNNNNINVNVFTLLPLNNGKHKENTPPLIFSSNVARKRANKDAARKKSASVSKKPRLVWTTSLHNIFLEAVKKVGLDKAVPKKILELMNVPGLKRVNVASHLQKYRIFLQRIEEATSSMQFGVPFDWNERPFRSSFVLNEITYLSQRFNQQTEDYIEPSEERMIVANMFGKGQGSNQVNNFLENHHPNVDTSLAVSDHIQVIKPSEGAQTLNQNVPKELPSIGGYFQGSSSGFSFEQQRNPQFDDDGVFNNINQPTFNNNYAGLRIGANGELVSTINNSTTAIHNDNDNIDNMGKAIHGHGYFTENCVADGHQVVNNEVNHAYNLTSIDYNNATPLADHFLATNDEANSYIDMPTDVEHNATHQQQNDFGSSQEMPNLDSIGDELRQLGIEFHDQETCCYDFDFGSNDVQCDDQGGLFEGLLDQVITSDDDIPFDCFLSQEYGQGFNQQDGRIDFSKPN